MDPETETNEIAAEVVATVAAAIEDAATVEVSSNEVELANIDANKEIAIAAINADARIAEAEAYSGNSNIEESSIQWDMNRLASEMTDLKALVTDLGTKVQSLVSSELMEVQTEATEAMEAEALEAEMLTPMENALTPNGIQEETSLTLMEAGERNGGDALIPPLVELPKGPLIKLV